MITKINKLKKFGIYKDFSWNGLDDFKQKNLIYGWNYSGKTTLSKLFQTIEFRDKNKHFSGSEFDITTKKDNTELNHTQNDLENFPYDIKVFNSDYIKRIFTFDLPNSNIQPISFYLGDPSGELDNKIKILNKKIIQLENIRDNRYQKIVDEFSNYNKKNGKFTIKAKEIRENYLDNKLDQNNLNKAKIQQITDKVKSDLSKYILSDIEKEKTKSKAITENTFELQKENFSFIEKLETLANKVKSILEDSAPKSIPLPELDENKILFNWVQAGIKLHENETDCKFCTNPLPKNRISDLNLYYSEKLQEIQNEIESVQKELKAENDKLNIQFPDKKNLENSYQKDYENSISAYSKTVNQYKAQLIILEKDLKRKASNYFNNIPITEIEIITLKKEFDNIESSIKAHNDWLNQFDENKAKSISEILNHYIAEYLQTENYNLKESNKIKSVQIISNINSIISTNNVDKLVLETQLKSSVKGQEELNDILEILLHRNDIRIEIKEDKFTLERSGHLASNLSEGEKSAIAFAYFLTELKSLRDDEPPKLYKTIVFIDDPISSLDSNHIFQVRLLLHNFFKIKDFAQLFISTHNFEFFSVMLDTKLMGRINKDTAEKNRPLYFIKRNDNNNSVIKKLPKAFSSYKSEYVGLFHIIKEFNDLEDKENFTNLLILPNAVRRFLELYTIMKYPSVNEVDNRVKQIFNPDDKPLYNTKLLHWFSHQNQFEKVQQHDDKILQIEDAISELLEYIETKDNLHWKGLNGE
ncbi:AAA family ATPase [Polaribacter sp. Z014]|uniref:AAA family ATPase n=1 Tax=Polaribacter sp. Z014 TaxID=2927126 RepID=UPI0020211A09|nr:AAA family ATPase [Polaribacter sp. Z014]MCL7765411.1 AAA family ATPase [Polaribacter sp. Z014]